MKKLLFLVFGAWLIIPANAQTNLKKAKAYAETITAADLRTHLEIIAGDAMLGRETATEGQRLAAKYLENQYIKLGLTPGFNGKWQMPYPVYRDSVTGASFAVNGKNFTLNKDFTVTTANHPATLKVGEVMFVNMDDSLWKADKVNVSGKMVMLYFQGLNQNQGRGGFGNTIFTRVLSLMAKGAAGVIAVQDIFPVASSIDPGQMSTNAYTNRITPNVFTVSPTVARLILGDKADAAEKGTLMSGPIKTQVDATYNEVVENLQSTNVLAVLPGTDLADEYLVISSHYDHLGVGKDGDVFNGADDDGSGTVSVLEIAEAFVKAKAAGKGPRRSIIFMNVSGEEKGLWGSFHYSENPVFPIDKTTADLNIDMVGRIDNLYDTTKVRDYVYVVGDDKLSSELTPITNQANKLVNLKLDGKYNDPKDRQRIYYRSDHYNFARVGVPIIFYFSGLHADYHRPTDTVDKIEFDVMTKRVKLVFYTAWEMANRDNMIKRDIPLPAGTTR